MCGIAGFQGDFDQSLLAQFSKMLAHRGPDNQSFWYDSSGRAGLVHTRLSIIDLSESSNQPLWDNSGRYCIVFNGEIYNYRELRAELIAAGATFRSNGDGEVILNAYLREGVAALNRLNGIFAFAIWDKVGHELFIARDPYGVKPLYYAQTDSGVVFASEIKALLCAKEVSRNLDHTALWHYLTFMWAPTPHTPLQAVRKLEPGHYLRISHNAISANERYAEYPPFSPAFQGGKAEAIAESRHLLEQAVNRQLVADVPVGAFLSGGVDSSAIAHFASKALDKKLQCFTIELQGADQEGMAEDLPFAKFMAKKLGVPLDVVTVSPDIIHDLPRMLFALDEPQADPAPLNSLYISQRARDMGIKVLLSGAGGDDIFSGYRRHYALQRESLWSWLPQPGRQMLSSATGHLPQGNPLLRRFSKAFNYANLTEQQRLVSYFFWIRPQQSRALFNPFIQRQLGDTDVAAPLHAALAGNMAHEAALNQMLYLEQKFFLIDHNFNYTDKTSMAAGVEVRVPFLDPDLVSYANKLPVSWKYPGSDGKWILKQAMTGLLPDSVLHRKKAGFGAPLRAWLRGPLRTFVEEMLSESTLKRRGIFDYRAVSQLVNADREGKIDAAYTIFSLICIEIWARQFIDPAVPTMII
jgi:asparagine synthase (glutamine-hydrolysing)